MYINIIVLRCTSILSVIISLCRYFNCIFAFASSLPALHLPLLLLLFHVSQPQFGRSPKAAEPSSTVERNIRSSIVL